MHNFHYIAVLIFICVIYDGKVNAICCYATAGCTYCDDCTPAGPYCSTGGCNIFGCNCAGVCRTGELCPIGAVGRRGQRVAAGPNCNIPYDRLAPHCAIVMPGRTSWEWVHACTTRGKRSLGTARGLNRFHAGHDFDKLGHNVSHVFHLADINLDGKLSYGEAYKYLENVPGLNVDQVGDEVAKLDKDMDGYLIMSELD